MAHAGRPLDQWPYLNGVGLDFFRPATPTDNASIEAFNARVRAEWLEANSVLSWLMRGIGSRLGGLVIRGGTLP
jgi:hypothetical protein